MPEGGAPEVFIAEKQQTFLSKIGLKSKIFFSLIILILVGVGGYVFFKNRFSGEVSVGEAVPLLPQSPENPAPSQVEAAAPVEAEPIPLFGDANYRSENFRVGEVSIGGEAEFLLSEDTPEPLEISSIRGEAFTEKSKQEVKLVVSWRTNRLARSEISYSKGLGQAKKVIEEEDYSLSHSVIIPGLDQASTYVYLIESSDRYGNEITSDPYAVYTGSRTVSLFDLIADAVGDVFGWAVKKN